MKIIFKYFLTNRITTHLSIKFSLLASLARVGERVVRFRALPENEPHLSLFCERSEQKTFKIVEFRTFLILLLLLKTVVSFGQQPNALFTYFRNNWQVINPAAASYSWFLEPQKNFVLSGTYRQQWMKLDNSPANYNIAFEHIPNLRSQSMGLSNYEMKLGAGAYGEEIWQDDLPFNRLGGYLNYAYALDLDGKQQRLTLGFNVGASTQKMNLAKLTYKDAGDERIQAILNSPNAVYKRLFLELNAGAFYSNGRNFYAGLSMPFSLNVSGSIADSVGYGKNVSKPTIFNRRPTSLNVLLGGAILDDSRNGNAKTGFMPSLWLRWQPDIAYNSLFQGNPISATANVRYMWESTFWFGVGMSTAKWAHTEAGFIFNNYAGKDYGNQDNKLSLGFAWDIPMAKTGWQLGQTFELTLCLTFANK